MAEAAGTEAAALEALLLGEAMALAEAQGWDAVRLSAVADRAGVPLAEVGRHFKDVDAIANAWFRRARLGMLEVTAGELQGRAVDERLAVVIGRWLDQLAPHRRVTGEMLRAKLYPGHPQHWVPAIFDLSRLVHDFLDVGRIEGDGRLRQAQEIGLTVIVLATLADWLRDTSPGQERSKARLRQRLIRGGKVVAAIDRTSRQRDSSAEANAVEPAPGVR